jgi:hypothetical protein
MNRVASFAALLLVSACVTLVSVGIERRGPELAQYGNLCGPTHDQPCMQPALNGGFPMAFLVDVPGVSVENQLTLIEDRFVPLGFAVDWVASALSLWLLWRGARRFRIGSRA